MADLDTRSKRASSVQILAPYILSPVLPDGTINQGDRQHTAWSYSGIAAGAIVAAKALTLQARSLVLTLKSRSLALTLQSRSLALTVRSR